MIFGSRLIPLCAIWFLALIRHLPHSWYESEHNIIAAHEIGMLPISSLDVCADVKTLLPAGICLVDCRAKGLLEASMGLPGRLPVARGHEGKASCSRLAPIRQRVSLPVLARDYLTEGTRSQLFITSYCTCASF